MNFNFSIDHRSGKDNVTPDTLSRAHEGEIFVEALEINNINSIDLESAAFDSDEYCRLRQDFSVSEFPDYRVIDKYIYKRVNFSSGELDESESWKLLVPKELRRDVIYSAHDVSNSAHGGIAKTLERVRRFFFWPGLATDVKTYILNCELCKTSKTPTSTLRPPLGKL
ncbi:hypothetical protein FF38_12919 [Lucilia cuprina]|uniref:RNA-directed DNA polymerase n=1 Tax=Lucilia cuprina TaxID=7375 RepID=A0A0L0CJ51_LUCCU|nr:hypothetical protein FF38_12919 [Lucilia cuprina]